jgi:hypothetical protein
MVGVIGCSGDTTEPAPSGNPSQLYVAMQLNQHAINMAVHDTMRLTAATLTGAGTQLMGAGPVRFITKDSSVTVDSTGLVTAQFAIPQTLVYASVTVHGVTHTDSALIQVTPTAPAPLVGFAIQLPPGQDTNVAVNTAGEVVFPPFGLTFPVLSHEATDASGDSIPLLVYYSSTNPVVAQATFISMGGYLNGKLYLGDAVLQAFQVGEATISVETWAYGVVKRSSRTFIVGPPHFAKIRMLAETPVASLTQIGTFTPSAYTVGVGAVVTWEDDSVDVPIDVVFDDSSAVQESIDINSTPYISCLVFNTVCPTATGAGNIPPFQADQNGPGDRARSFPTAGTYTYHSSLYGTRGKIIVR